MLAKAAAGDDALESNVVVEEQYLRMMQQAPSAEELVVTEAPDSTATRVAAIRRKYSSSTTAFDSTPGLTNIRARLSALHPKLIAPAALGAQSLTHAGDETHSEHVPVSLIHIPRGRMALSDSAAELAATQARIGAQIEATRAATHSNIAGVSSSQHATFAAMTEVSRREARAKLALAAKARPAPVTEEKR